MSLSLRQQVRLALVRSALVAWREATRPRVVTALDLGCQEGLLGAVMSEVFPSHYTTGVDAWAPHVEERSPDYGAKVCGDAVDYLQAAAPVDAVLACELIEHLDRERGAELLRLALSRSRLAVLSAPLGFMAQGAIHGNPHEVHRSAWSPEDFTAAGLEVYATSPALHLGVYVWSRDRVRWRV